MFLRSVQQLRRLQRLPSLTVSIKTGIDKSYATCSRAWTPTSNNLGSKLNQQLSGNNTLRHASQQPAPVVEAEMPSKQSIEFAMGKLDVFYQRFGFIGIEQLTPLLEKLKSQTGQQLTREQGLFLLNVCGTETPSLMPNERMASFQQIWQYLQDTNMIAKDHYHTMLQALQYNQAQLNDYKTLLQEYESHKGAAKDIFSDLLAVAGASGNVKQTTEILAEMRSLQMALTERDFNSLLLAHARAKDMNGFQTVRDSMHATGVTISSETQATLVMAFMENANESKALSILQDYHGQFHDHQVINMLRSVNLSIKPSKEFVANLVKEFQADYVLGGEVPIDLRRVCVELLHNNKLNYAMTIIDALPTPKFQENQDVDTFCVFMLNALFSADCKLAKIIEIATSLEDSGKNTRALYIAAEIALRRSPPMALPIFEALVKREQTLKAHYFWPLMMYNFRRHNESGILKTLKIMQDFKVECDHQTIVQYVLPKLSITITNPQIGLKQMEEAGIKTSLIMTPIVSHMLTQHKWSEVTALVEAYTTKIQMADLISPLCSVAVHIRATKRYHQFAKLLNALANKNIDRKQDVVGQFLIELLSSQQRVRTDLYCLQRLFGEMHKIGLSLSPGAVSTIQSLLGENSSEGSDKINQKLREMTKRSLTLGNNSEDGSSATTSSFIKHPREMSLDELECHLVELEAKGMNARGVLRRMLQLCVRENRLERALQIKQKCDVLRVQTSPGMLASIFEMHIKLKDLQNASQSLKQLEQTYPGFQIDEHKFIDYASLLVSTGKLEVAKNMLEERSLKHTIIGGDYVLKNVWNFLTNVARYAATLTDLSSDRNLTRETYAYLQNLGYCRTHNTILGPIIRERLLRGDLPAAIGEFKQLATQYKHTPLQFELLSLIVRLCNGNDELRTQYNCSVEEAQQLLSEITEIVTKVHGNINMNSGLLLAFAESGSDNQMRRLLINPEFRINEDLLLRNCEHLGKEGAVQTLLRLARGSRGLHRVIDEQNIYNMLLNNFIKSNDYEAALNLYERLETDDDLKISQDFLRNIVALLKTNNIEIPGNIALRARIV